MVVVAMMRRSNIREDNLRHEEDQHTHQHDHEENHADGVLEKGGDEPVAVAAYPLLVGLEFVESVMSGRREEGRTATNLSKKFLECLYVNSPFVACSTASTNPVAESSNLPPVLYRS